jgi:FKBP-type peptidyl-prolyl cis-trans isomerase
MLLALLALGNPDPKAVDNVLMPKGVHMSLAGMQPGEMRYLRVPSMLGFGSTMHGHVPPNSILFYQVTLLELYPTADPK